MLTDDGASRGRASRRVGACLMVILACGIGGCSSSGGSSSPGLLGLRRNADPNVRYVAYNRKGDHDVFGHRPGIGDAVAERVKKYWSGPGVGARLRNFTLKRKNGLP